MNTTEIIYAPREIGQTWHAEQRSLSGGSKLIEHILLRLHVVFVSFSYRFQPSIRKQ